MLHVADLKDQQIEASRLFPVPSSFLDVEKYDKKELLEAFLGKANYHFKTKNHRFFGQLEYGNLVDAIKRQLTEKRIDLIVMGTRGVSNITKRVIGSNTGAIITRVRCNTLVVPERAIFHYLKRITFPTDFTIFYTPKILRTLSEVLELNKGKLDVVYVSPKKNDLTEAQKITKAYLFDYLDEVFQNRYNHHIIHHKRMIDAIQGFVMNQKVDMIAIVARNLNFLQQLFFDTRVEKMSFHTKVPMFVIHE